MADKIFLEAGEFQPLDERGAAANFFTRLNPRPPFQRGIGQRAGIADGDDLAVHAGLDQVGGAGVRRRNYGQTARQRLGDDEREAVLDGGKQKQIRSLVTADVVREIKVVRPFNR